MEDIQIMKYPQTNLLLCNEGLLHTKMETGTTLDLFLPLIEGKEDPVLETHPHPDTPIMTLRTPPTPRILLITKLSL